MVARVRTGEAIGDYTLLRPIDRGGFASVWLADHADGRLAALKVLDPHFIDHQPPEGPSAVDRFLAEANILARLEHPGVVRIYDLIDERADGVLAYAMERITGYKLSDVAPLSTLPALIDVFTQVAETLSYVHSAGVIHRDVKPSNILVCDSADRRVKLIDFGIAKDTRDDAPLASTAMGQFAGTLGATPPECFLRTAGEPIALDGSVDQWGFGVALFACLSGGLPFPGQTTAELVNAILNLPPRPLRIAPSFRARRESHEAIERILLRCLEKAPSARYRSCAELAQVTGALVARLDSDRRSGVFKELLDRAAEQRLAKVWILDRAAVRCAPGAEPARAGREPSTELVARPDAGPTRRIDLEAAPPVVAVEAEITTLPEPARRDTDAEAAEYPLPRLDSYPTREGALDDWEPDDTDAAVATVVRSEPAARISTPLGDTLDTPHRVVERVSTRIADRDPDPPPPPRHWRMALIVSVAFVLGWVAARLLP